MMRKITLLLFCVTIWSASFAQPVISTDVAKVSDALANGATSAQSFTITNNGDANLNWSIILSDSLSNGTSVNFVKNDNTDWTLTSNQDRISNTVWITRDLTKSIFNAKSEAVSGDLSPQGTLWSLGHANQTVSNGVFTDFIAAHGGSPVDLIGDTITLYLEDDDLYYDVAFTSYSGGGSAGGFAYTREQMMSWFSVSQSSGTLTAGASITINVAFNASILASELHTGGIVINSNDPVTPQKEVVSELDILPKGLMNIVESSLSASVVSGNSVTVDLTIENTATPGADLKWRNNNVITVTKLAGADFTLEENQDRITDDVWITRGSNRGLYNIAQESAYDRGTSPWPSPIGTEWAYGKTSEVSGSYVTWRESYRNITQTYLLPGKTLSMHLIKDDVYYDIEFIQWSRRSSGFAYKRINADHTIPDWFNGLDNGVVSSGSSSTITYTLNSNGLIPGVYTYNLEVKSSNDTQLVVTVPVTLTVLGTPEITTDSYHNYGDVLNGVAQVYQLPIANTGTNVLTVTNITTDSAEFTLFQTSVTLQPGANTTVPVIFTPSRLGFIQDTIRIESNDTITPLTKVVIEGTGIDLPAISLSSYSFSDNILVDSTSVDTIVMTNTGKTDMYWSIGVNEAFAIDESGFVFNFTKDGYADTDLAENRDSITPDVSLTGNNGGLDDYNGNNIEWALGSTYDALSSNVSYNSNWQNAMNGQIPMLQNETISLHIIDEDVYVDIHISHWESNYSGNGYSYTRTAPMPIWLAAQGEVSGNNGILAPDATENIIITHDASFISSNKTYTGEVVIYTNVPSEPEVVISNSITVSGINPILAVDKTAVSATLIAGGLTTKEVTITNNGTSSLAWQIENSDDIMASNKVKVIKFNSANYNLPENQDRITDLVWLTRADDKGLFNIAQEATYDDNNNTSPAGTEWAYGYSLELSPNAYGTWYDLHNEQTPKIVGKPVSLHLIEEDIYFDIMFTSWQANGKGGGFSYIRSEPSLSKNWYSVSPKRGAVAVGESQEVSITFDAADKIAGTYTSDIKLLSNDKDITITASLEVLGNPEIQLPSAELAFGDAYIGFNNTMELTIQNIGNDVLNISNITFNESTFSVSSTTLQVAPYGEAVLTVIFNPTAEQVYAGVMTLVTDDPINPSVSVSLSGTGIKSPTASVNITELSVAILTGETITKEFVVKNTGMGVLDWNLGVKPEEVTVTKKAGADFRIADNQDRITDDVWITRASLKGLFNIAQENMYDRSADDAPAGTEWAYGTTANVSPSDYTTWRDAIRNDAGIRLSVLAGYTFSMRLINSDKYYDVTFLEWGEDNGGSFSYTRKSANSSTLSNNWVVFSKESGTLATGESDTITVIFNPYNNISAGNYDIDMQVQSNDPNGAISLPISLEVSGILVVNPIADTIVVEGFASYTEDISSVFLSGSDLTYTVTSSNESVVTVVENSDVLTVTEVGIGTSTITISAADGVFSTPATTTFDVTVELADIPDGIESSIIDGFKLYPNPSQGFTTLSFAKDFNEKSVVTVTSISGKQVFHKTYTANGSNVKLDLSSLNKGLYLINIKSTSVNLVKKLVIE